MAWTTSSTDTLVSPVEHSLFTTGLSGSLVRIAANVFAYVLQRFSVARLNPHGRACSTESLLVSYRPLALELSSSRARRNPPGLCLMGIREIRGLPGYAKYSRVFWKTRSRRAARGGSTTTASSRRSRRRACGSTPLWTPARPSPRCAPSTSSASSPSSPTRAARCSASSTTSSGPRRRRCRDHLLGRLRGRRRPHLRHRLSNLCDGARTSGQSAASSYDFRFTLYSTWCVVSRAPRVRRERWLQVLDGMRRQRGIRTCSTRRPRRPQFRPGVFGDVGGVMYTVKGMILLPRRRAVGARGSSVGGSAERRCDAVASCERRRRSAHRP